MPKVSTERLKGGYGASLVAARLSAKCLVRSVSADTDVGVDLYCESVEADKPFLHFWVQVKTGSQCVLNSTANNCSCNFATKHLHYWNRQPVPVFAALVPTGWPPLREPDVHIVNVTRSLLYEGIPDGQKVKRLTSDFSWPAGDAASVQNFLQKTVPRTSAELQVANGVVANQPTVSPKYEVFRPGVPVMSFMEPIKQQLRTTAASSIIFALGSAPPKTHEEEEFHRLLARIVEGFIDAGDVHWENWYAAGLSKHADNDFARAANMYESAWQSIERDSSVGDLADWKERVRKIQKAQSRANQNRPLHINGKDCWIA